MRAFTGQRTALPESKEPPLIVIRPTRGWASLQFQELWAYRELIFFLAWRDISVRYKQTVLGALWAVLQPLMLMIVFTIVFGIVARIPSEGIPYPLFVYAGLLPWQLFAYALTEASGSIVANERLITKVYFPRLIIPVASVIPGVVDFAVAFGLLLVLMATFQVSLAPTFWAFPFFVLLAFTTAIGVGLWLSALNVQFRDVRYTLPFLTQLWLLVTPIVYPSQLMPPQWRIILGLNPMAGVVEGFRWSLLGTTAPSLELLAVSAGAALVLVASGALYFRRAERTFADII